MDTLEMRRQQAKKTLARLNETLIMLDQEKNSLKYEVLRDSIIQRFEFTIDTFWKFLKEHLLIALKLNVQGASSRVVFRMCLNENIITNQEFNHCIGMIEDRNRTSHTYDETIAEQILERIPEHYALLKMIMNRTK